MVLIFLADITQPVKRPLHISPIQILCLLALVMDTKLVICHLVNKGGPLVHMHLYIC